MTAVVSTSSTYAIRCGGTVNNQGKSAARGEFTRIIRQCNSGSAAELGTRGAYGSIPPSPIERNCFERREPREVRIPHFKPLSALAPPKRSPQCRREHREFADDLRAKHASA